MRGITWAVRAAMFCCIAFLISLAVPATAQSSKPDTERLTGFVKVDGNRALFVDYEKPAPGKPVVVLINGLTYRTGSWDAFVRGFRGEGYGILRWDPMGMGQTLVKYAPATEPFPVLEQVEDMRRLFTKLNLKQPVYLVGLSYGGALASIYAVKYPEHVAKVIAMAPFVAPLEQQDQWIKLQIKTTRLMFPYNPYSDDVLYDWFLRNIIYSTYPYAEPVVLENPYKLEATFRLVQGIRRYQFAEIADRVPPGKFHLVVARQDQYLPFKMMEQTWNEIPPRVRQSRVIIEESEHKIVEDVPLYSASLVKHMIANDQVFSKGRTVIAVPSKGIVHNGRDILIRDMPKD